jgi:hypothetical protein
VDAGQKKMNAQVGSLTYWINVIQEQLMAKMDTQLEKMEAWLGKTEATDLEANPVEIEFETVHEGVPKEKAAVKIVRALKKQHRGWHLAVRHRCQPKK